VPKRITGADARTVLRKVDGRNPQLIEALKKNEAQRRLRLSMRQSRLVRAGRRSRARKHRVNLSLTDRSEQPLEARSIDDPPSKARSSSMTSTVVKRSTGVAGPGREAFVCDRMSDDALGPTGSPSG
jgi:hypothetical protein